MVSVLLVDDHHVLRNSLQYVIEAADDLQVVATALNGMEAIDQARSGCPDIIVMDNSMPLMDGMEATKQILVHSPLTRVLLLSMDDTPDRIRRALEMGANGYVLKDTIANDLVSGIRTLHAGKHYFSQKVSEMAEKYLLERKRWLSGLPVDEPYHERLSTVTLWLNFMRLLFYLDIRSITPFL